MTYILAQASPELVSYLKDLHPEEGLLLDGSMAGARDGALFDVVDPASGEVLARCADACVEDATRAVDAAAAALGPWSATAPRERAEVLRRAFTLMVEEVDDLTRLISAENGKSLADARAEVLYAAEFFRWFSEEAVRTEGGFGVSPAGGTRTIVTHRPVGVVAMITPWNFPAAMGTRKIAPALAAGCTVVLRPASLTPLTAVALGRILQRAGVPAGVVSIVPSTRSAEVSQTWLADPRVRAVSFTGSTEVGRTLLEQAARRVLVPSMELGGNAPFVVAADADVEAAVTGAVQAKLRGGGQACTAANRFYVHADVVETFTEALGAVVRDLRVGPPLADEANQLGPMVSARARDQVNALVEEAVQAGARVAASSSCPQEGGGFFLPARVLADVAPDAQVLRTEIFGPVAPVVAWQEETDLLRWVNDSEHGLAGYVFSQDLGWALRLAERMEVGMVGINRGLVSDPAAPFGGLKQSGLGREGAREGIREFQETQYFSVAW
ncbi:NAD-dependent succinate-semialdehyde dehydrogenase [Actinomyces lilanjuaniae]|uniref:NAD-dependent succinate-semialdehyde dehydrogenase n=1 Tax=Actinomyces lilanjuaniae TaxID=2321394 RepID=A0ABN5PR16_9ACTO|nr:NAD-dependent succinate-semialdehyde dehydrogenase [Actinomyces lilanjuaniae]AYD90626.1 NAD-dependent succinate-semialdehyde dehydrogenase [Actinomyces lilanjuaniae]